MKDLNSVIDFSKYAGVMFIGDLHSEINPLELASKYAIVNDLFLVSVGDLFDGGEFPFEVADTVVRLLDDGSYAQVRGNHDDKHYRYAIGNPVKLGPDQLATLDCVGEPKHDDFINMVKYIYDHDRTSFCFKLLNLRIAHAGVHRKLWQSECVVNGGIKSLALYGEHDGTITAEGYKNRTYNWTDDIPLDHAVVVGHARDALGKSLTKPLVHFTTNGGSAFFIDTSCGKIPNGPLTGAVFLKSGDNLKFSHFGSFV